MKKLPRLNLSQYDTERLDSTIESIIVQGLVYFKGNIKRTAVHFNLSEETVTMIFIKYYATLDSMIENQEKDKRTEKSINTALKLYDNHIQSVETMMTGRDGMLPDKMTKNINSILDRLVTVKENRARVYNKTVQNLNDTIVKMKQLEVLETGKVESDTDYKENQQTVLQMLQDYQPLKTPVRAINIHTKEERTFESITECANAFEMNHGYLCKKLDTGTPYKDEWIFQRI